MSPTPHSPRSAMLRHLPAGISGILLGVIGLSVAAAYASLLFKGAAAAYTGLGFSVLLAGTGVGALLLALLSRQPGLISGPDEAAVVILASLAGTLTGIGATPAMDAGQAAATIVLLMGGAGVMCGVLFWLVARFRLANMIRFLPYPVISGYLGGAGLMLGFAGLGLAGGIDHLGLQQPASLLALAPAAMKLWPALLIAMVLHYGGSRFKHPLFMPLTLLGGSACFFAVSSIAGISMAELQQQGWLIRPPEAAGDSAAFFASIGRIDGASLLTHLPGLILVAAASLISMLLQISALESILQKDMALEGELRAQGQANLLAGCFGSLPLVTFIGDTLLNLQIGGATRLAGVVMAVVCFAGVLFGSALLAWIPQFILAGLLVYFGLGMLLDAVDKARAATRRPEQWLMVLVALAVNVLGFMEGALLGVFITAALFLIDYSRMDIIRQHYHAANAPGRVTRPGGDKAWLEQDAHWLSVYVLEGYLFFGGAQRLYDRARREVDSAGFSVLIVDFHHVQGMDITAVNILARLAARIRDRNGLLLLCGIRDTVRPQLAALATEHIIVHHDLDHAIEHAEEHRLRLRVSTPAAQEQAFDALLASVADYGSTRELPAQALLIEQGAASSGLYFVTAGSVSVRLAIPGRAPLRLRRFVKGTVLGEISFYTGGSTVASIEVDEAAQVFNLSPAQLQRLEQEQPQLALQLHKAVAAVMALRLQEMNRSLQQATA